MESIFHFFPRKERLVKILLLVSICSLWQMRQLGNIFSETYKEQLMHPDLNQKAIRISGNDGNKNPLDHDKGPALSTQDKHIALPGQLGTPSSEPGKNTSEVQANEKNGSTIEGNETETLQLLLHSVKREESPEAQKAIYEAFNKKFYDTRPDINASTYTTVDREVYQKVVEKAKATIHTVAEDVYTGCELYILPGDDDKKTPKVQFKCLGENNSTLQNDLCHTVNLCRVVTDEKAWKLEDTVASSNNYITNDNITSTKKATLLMMVDSVPYLLKKQNFWNFLNKASYAYRSDRSFYIWIGDLDKTELNKRNIETLSKAFDFRCATKHFENSNHNYKPIAFLVLFDLMRSLSTEPDSIFFMDADAAFFHTGFELIENDKLNRTNSTSRGNSNSVSLNFGPETYFDISPQASLIATTNINGRTLMNSAFMLVRDTPWMRDFMALWWYSRCGFKDQHSLWASLYVFWSAVTEGPLQFPYPGMVFFEYKAAYYKLFQHFKKYAHNIQSAWEAAVEERHRGHESIRDEKDDYWYPLPTNTTYYNGGEMKGPKLHQALELPHVVILPPKKSIRFPTESNRQIILPRLKVEDVGTPERSLTIHVKQMDSCSDMRCWPYLEMNR